MAYQPPLNGGRINASIGGNSTSAGGGYSMVSTGTLHLMGGNNITLSQNANSVTISGATIPAQTQYVFSNSNGVSFGTNASTVTATVQTNYALSTHSHGNPTLNLTNISGTTASASNGLTLSLSAASQTVQTQNMMSIQGSTGNVSFGNANGITFGGNASTLTASHNGLTSQSAQAMSASNGSFAFQTAGFSNGNGVTFGTSAGSIMSASVNTSYAGSNHSHGNPTLNLTNISGTTASNSGGLTLSLSAAAPGGGGGAAFSAGTQSVSTGTVNFANSNGVTFGMSASNQITASVATTYAGSNHSHGNPTLNLTNLSGTTGSASNGLTLSLSAAAQSIQTQGLQSVVLSGNTAGAMATISSGQMTFAGGNNITLSQNGNAVTISGGAGGGGGGIALSASNATFTSGTVKLTNAGGAITIGTAAQEINFSVPTVSSLSATGIVSLSNNAGTISIGAPAFSAGISNIGNTSGTSGMATNQLVFAGGDNITLSQATGAGGRTITISGGAGGGGGKTATMWYPYNEAVNVAGQVGQGSLGLAPVPTPGIADELHVDRLLFPLYFTNASNSSGSLTVSFWMGMYTRTLSSISLAYSTSATASLGYAGNNSSASQRGIKLLSIGWSTTFADNRYVMGIISRSTTAGANATLSQMLISQINSNFSGMWNEASNATNQWPIGLGHYSVTTSALPASIAYSQIRGTGSIVARPPSWHMVNGSA